MKKFLIALACCTLSACYYYVPEDTYVEDVYTTPGYYGQTTYVTPSTSHVYIERQPEVVYIDSPHHHYTPAPHRYHYPEPKHHKAAPRPSKHKNSAPAPRAERQRHNFGGPERVVKIPDNNHHHGTAPQKHTSHGGKHKK